MEQISLDETSKRVSALRNDCRSDVHGFSEVIISAVAWQKLNIQGNESN